MWYIRDISFYAPSWKELKKGVSKTIDVTDRFLGKKLLSDMGNEGRDLSFSSYTSTYKKRLELSEITANRKYNPVWLQDDVYNNQFSGWYYISDFQYAYANSSNNSHINEFKMSLKYAYGSDYRLATYGSYSTRSNDWDKFTVPLYTTVCSGVNISPSSVRSITTVDNKIIYVTNDVQGSMITYKNPTSKNLMYSGGECRIFDTNNEVSESNWQRVYDIQHSFLGNIVFDNNAWRFKAETNYLQLQVYNNGAWNNLSRVYISANGGIPEINYFEIIDLSPDELTIVINFFDAGASSNLRIKMTRGLTSASCRVISDATAISSSEIIFSEIDHASNGITLNYDEATDNSLYDPNNSLTTSSNDNWACLIGKNTTTTSGYLGITYLNSPDYQPQAIGNTNSFALGDSLDSNSALNFAIWGNDPNTSELLEGWKQIEIEDINVVGSDVGSDSTASASTRVDWSGDASFTDITNTDALGLPAGTYRVYLRYQVSNILGEVKAISTTQTLDAVSPSVNSTWVFQPLGDIKITGTGDYVKIQAKGSYTWRFDEMLLVPVYNSSKIGVYDRNLDALKLGTQTLSLMRGGYLPR